MAIVKALRRLAGGSFGLIAATDQIACDAGAMTVTPTGGVQQSVPAAIAARVLGDANGRVRPSKLDVASMAANLCPNGDFEEVLAGQCVGWGLLNMTGAGNAVAAFSDASFNGTTSLLLTKGSTGTNTSVSAVGPRMPVEAKTAYDFSLWLASMAGVSAAGFSAVLYWYDRSDAYLTLSQVITNAPIPGAWTKYSAPIVSPAGAMYARIGPSNDATSTVQYLAIDGVNLRKAVGANGLEDQAIVPRTFYAPTRGQFFRALENSGAGRVATVTDAVPSNRGNAINIAFAHTQFVTQSGVLAQHVKTTLSLTDAQLASIIAAARSVAE